MTKLPILTAESSLIRYIIVGGISYLLELSFILIFTQLGFTPLAAVAIAFWLGFTASFVLQKLFAFKNTERTPRRVMRQIGTYSALVLINYLFTLVFVLLTEPHLGIVISRTIALAVTTCWNYLLYRYVIFSLRAN